MIRNRAPAIVVAALILILGASQASATPIVLGEPGGSSNFIPFGWNRAGKGVRYQQIYDSTLFTTGPNGETGPFGIEAIRLRPGSIWSASDTFTYEVWLGVTGTPNFGNFDANLSQQSVRVHSDTRTFGGSVNGPFFDFATLATPYVYDPTLGGDLVMDVRISSTPGTQYAIDAAAGIAGFTRLWAANVNASAPDGFGTGYGLVTEFEIVSAAPAPPTIPDIPPQTQQEFVGSVARGWESTYDIGFTNQALTIDLNIALYGADPGAALRDQWEQGIEGIWSDAFDITDGVNTYPIQVNVNWVSLASPDADFWVLVTEGTGQPTMLHWYTDDPGGWGNSYHDEVAAHEAGHMMGLFDEYLGGVLDPDTLLTTTNSIMADLGPPQPWHYTRILEWLAGQVNVNLSLASSPLPPYVQDAPIPDFGDRHPLTPVPEPGTWSLALAGLAALGILARTRLRRRPRVS